MIDTPVPPVTRQLRAALTCAAAVLCIPTQGFAGPIGLSNMAVWVQDVRAVSMTTHLEAAHLGDGFAALADDRPDWMGAALASPANWPTADRGPGWTQERFERSDGAGLTNDRVVGDTSAPIAVSEPSTLILLGAGLIGAASWTRRRKS
jgi:hypothetical protein